MASIDFSREEKTLIVERLQRYFRDELNQEIGEFDAEFLLGFISEELGPFFYNQGLYDAQAIFQKSVDSIVDSIYQVEKPTPYGRS
jgi:uncharacterized protein (DUF2164 family)